MRRAILFLITVVLISWSIPSFASTSDRFRGGFKRVITAPFQVSDNVRTEGSNAKFMPFGVTGGFIKGCFYMVKEMLSGTIDMATSPIDNSRKNKN